MKLSIVTTLYRSAASIEEFYRRAIKAAEQVAGDVELVMVNDGSPDNSLDLAIKLQTEDTRVIVVDLSRNFGHHKALMTGLAHATGDLVFLIDSDLEEQPEDLALFQQRMAANDCEVVYGMQEARRGSAFERITGGMFFAVVDMLGDRPLPRNLVTSRLMRRNYVNALIRHRDREFVISDLWQVTGFRQVPITVKKLSRSPSTYSVQRRVEMAIKHITTTSTRLLYLVLYTGLLIFGLSIIVILYYLTRYFTSGIGVNGFTSIIVSIWFLGGLITLILGILGIHVANILAETKRRPYTIVRRVYRGETTPASVGAQDVLPMTRDHSRILSQAASYYASRLAQHGATPQGVDWNGVESHERRHAQFLRLLAGHTDASVIDLGCGFGDFLRFLRAAGHHGQFTGYDVAPGMIEKARQLHGEGSDRQWHVGTKPAEGADFAFASGIFNVREDIPDEDWRSYVHDTIDILAGASRRGFAFNVLSLSSDPERRQPRLYYADPVETLNYCLSRFGRSVALLQDYELHEFTVLIRKLQP